MLLFFFIKITSPFKVNAAPGIDASKVKVTGPGVSGTTPASSPAAFNVDTRQAGDADLEVFVRVNTFKNNDK